MSQFADPGRGMSAGPGNVSVQRPGFEGQVDISLAGRITGRDLFTHVVLRWLGVGFVAWLISLPFALAIALAQTSDADQYYSTGPQLSDYASLLITFIFPTLIAFASLFIPVRIANSQYGQLLEGASGGAESAYGHIYRAITARETPVDRVTPRRMSPGMGRPVSNYIQISKQKMEMWVIVMASGRDLWVAWTAWVRHVPIIMPFEFVMQYTNRLIIKGSDFHEALRLNEVRAVQKAIHEAVIDGVDATIAGEVTTVAQAFGYEIPIESSSSSARSVPVPVPAPVPSAPTPAPAPVPTVASYPATPTAPMPPTPATRPSQPNGPPAGPRETPSDPVPANAFSQIPLPGQSSAPVPPPPDPSTRRD